jgi:glc operon protein GlcG
MHKLAFAALFGAILFMPEIARAQTPAPAVPEAMPFDIPYGAPINMDDAYKGIMAAVTEARKHNWKMAVSVVDPSGNLIAHATIDGTQIASIAIAQAKARTAALYRRPTKVLQDAVNGANGPPIPGLLGVLAISGGVASEGGYPIVKDGKLIGAIGASGGIAPQDGVTARAGLTAVGGSAN